MPAPITLSAQDNVAILTERARAGETPLGRGVPLEAPVSPGHKLAARPLEKGDAIVKFGETIGYATQPIPEGGHVHVHNCAFGAHDQEYAVGVDLAVAQAMVPKLAPRTFMGFRRGAQVGTRNMIALIATVNCSATVIRRAADEIMASGMLAEYPHVDGVVAFTHGSGCAMDPQAVGFSNLQRVLWGHATHPNVGAAIFVGLGCEVMQVARMKQYAGDHGGDDRFHGLTIQENGGTLATVALIKDKVRELLPEVNRARREEVPVSALKVALQCGGSDGFSGITANPALGRASDMLAGLGASAVLAETPEIYGAEQLLLRRAASAEVGAKLIERIRWWEDYTRQHGSSMDNNPSPGNKAGGLTTILEKSLGAAAKGGSTPLTQVVDYAAPVTEPGFVFMDSPGYDPTSVTGQIASGCQVVVFTTGRGSAFGSKPAPTIKLATNDRLYRAMPDDMDINCGDIVTEGVTLEQKGAEILERIIAVAGGERSKSEALNLGDNEFVPWNVGAVM